ncbi:MAG: TRAP transporter large permease [Hyphomicrobiaceae bacterium]|nr:MAG: TRAP transporter large permease [Hyphomicrobiaceae bacterium]
MELTKDAIGLIGCLALIVLVFAGVRVYIAAALVGLAGIVAIIGWKAGAGIVGTIPHSKSVNYTLSVLPLFILIGYLAYHAGITQSLFDAAKKWMGWMPGGLAIATVFAVAAFSAVSGASTAAAAVFARVAIPEMLKAGYAKRLAAGVVSAGGTLDALIPPSVIMVVYAIIVEASVGKLIIAGFLPGLISALCYTLIIVVWSVIDPTVGRPIRGFTWGERFASLPGTVPVIGVIVIIFSAMYYGWATPTEAGALGAFVVYVLALFKGMRWKPFNDALLETAKLTVMIFAIIWGILIFVRFLGFAGVPEKFSEWVVSLPLPRVIIMIGILGVYLILGCFMDAIGMMLLTLPVVYPAVIKLGYDPIWFGIIVVKMAGVCLLTPPIGLNCFVVAAVRPDIPLSTVFRGALPFVIADFLAIAIFLAWPESITWLPDQIMK